jgi:heme/copper-type cytochrome/quinol oxidase subunit 2
MMLLESMTVEGLYIISLALSANEKWRAAGRPFNGSSNLEGWLTGLAVIALIISEILLFWVFNKYKRSEQQLNKKITDMSVTNVKLKQEKEKSKAVNEKLRQKLAELKAINEKLRQESAQLTRTA